MSLLYEVSLKIAYLKCQVNKKAKVLDIHEEEDGGNLIDEEIALSGKVSLSVYKYFAKNIGYIILLVVILLYGTEQAFRTGANVWLKHW